MVHPRDGTKTSLGIIKMRELFKKGGRKGVPWVCIVVTDGLSKDPPKTMKEAAIAKEMGKLLGVVTNIINRLINC